MQGSSKKSELRNKLYELLIELDRVACNNNLKYNLAYGTALGAVREQGFIEWDRDVDIMVTIDEYEKFCTILESEIDEKFCIYSPEKDNSYIELFSRIGFKDVPDYKLHIDIFPIVGAPKNKLGRHIFGKLAYLIFFANFMKNINIKERRNLLSKKGIIAISISKLIFFPIPTKLLKYMYNKLRTMFSIENSDYVYNLCSSYKYKEFIPKTWIIESEYKKFNDLKLPVPKEWDKYLSQIYGDYMTPRKQNFYWDKLDITM